MRNSKLAAPRAAFPYTVPIFAGFWFLAMAYGIQMSTSGFAFWYPMVMSAVIYGGSLEFVAVSMLRCAASLLPGKFRTQSVFTAAIQRQLLSILVYRNRRRVP